MSWSISDLETVVEHSGKHFTHWVKEAEVAIFQSILAGAGYIWKTEFLCLQVG